MVSAPTKETVEFAWKSYTSAPNADVKWASAYTFGSAVRHLAQENPDLALKLSNQAGHRHPKAENFRPTRGKCFRKFRIRGLGPS